MRFEISSLSTRIGIAAAAACFGILVGTGPIRAADHPFTILSGAWSGSAQVRLAGGNSETLKCKAYYTPKESGASLGLAIRCASPSNKIELRANLVYVAGKVSGRWEERTYNAMGDVTGQASAGKISLSIVGGGFTGTMQVTTQGSSQSVLIKTEGTGLQGVNISLSRG